MIATLALLAALVACQGETPATSTPATGQAPAAGGPASTEGKTPVTSATGLSYVILSEGSGAAAAAGDNVTMQYTGWLTDGTKFDSSRDSGRPFKFTLGAGEVIAAWDSGVAQMTLGQRALLRVPSALGYGAHGVGDGLIPPHADLEFDVELLAINGRRATAPQSAAAPAPVVAAPTAVSAAVKPAPAAAAAAATAATAPAAKHESAASSAPAPAASAAAESTVLLTRSVMSNAALFELD